MRMQSPKYLKPGFQIGILLCILPTLLSSSFSSKKFYKIQFEEVEAPSGLSVAQVLNPQQFISEFLRKFDEDNIDNNNLIFENIIIEREEPLSLSTLQQIPSSPTQPEIREPSRYQGIQVQRNYCLTMINRLRSSYNLTGLTLDEDLSKVAQAHSEDMARRGFFDHINLKGESPTQRVKNAGLGEIIVAENLAKANSLQRGDELLKNSPAHFKNTIGKDWTKAGIGIAFTGQGQFMITILFSGRDIVKEPLKNEEMMDLKHKFVESLSQSTNVTKENQKMSQDIQIWAQNGQKTPIFQYLTQKGYSPRMYRATITTSYSGEVGKEVGSNERLCSSIPKDMRQVGLGIAHEQQNLSFIMIFTY